MKKQILPLLFATLTAIAAAPFATAVPLATKEKVKKYGIVTAKFAGAGAAIILALRGLCTAARIAMTIKKDHGSKDFNTRDHVVWTAFGIGHCATAATTAFVLIKSALNDLKATE